MVRTVRRVRRCNREKRTKEAKRGKKITIRNILGQFEYGSCPTLESQIKTIKRKKKPLLWFYPELMYFGLMEIYLS